MLTKTHERLLRDLLTKKGRKERGMFVIEGRKFVNDGRIYLHSAGYESVS
jgi:hypothetical protein